MQKSITPDSTFRRFIKGSLKISKFGKKFTATYIRNCLEVLY